jgi:hypothetical protein
VAKVKKRKVKDKKVRKTGKCFITENGLANTCSLFHMKVKFTELKL